MSTDIIEVIARGVWRQRGRVLVCRNRKHGHAFLPGGHVEHGEDARAALVREMWEEVGLRMRAGRFLGVCESVFRDPRAKGRVTHEVNLVFELRPAAGERVRPAEVRSREDKIDFDWMVVASLRRARRSAVTRPPLLPAAIAQLIPTASRTHGTAGRAYLLDARTRK